ncbi:MAG TPA: membrane protein insertion efficiency factor YidD [Candidatus Binataceae bacterium]|nr:membrane protein insertion efficiency factor YidD [Candidatus Binataceae bacterium]
MKRSSEIIDYLRFVIRAPALGILAAYRAAISPLLMTMFGGSCRFEPSCSIYASAAISEHGIGRGGFLAVRRLLRCHPLGGHGYDPVPATSAVKAALD